MKRFGLMALLITAVIFVCYEFFAFPLDASRAAQPQAGSQAVSSVQSRNLRVQLEQDKTGEKQIVLYEKSLIFNRFRYKDQYKVDAPHLAATCGTTLFEFGSGINDAAKLFIITRLHWNAAWFCLLWFLVWNACRKTLYALFGRKKVQELG